MKKIIVLQRYQFKVIESLLFFLPHIQLQKACNILVEGSTPFYSLSNHGAKRNCTLTSMTPSVVTLRAINIGAEHQTANYDVSCRIFEVKKTLRMNSFWQ